MISRLIMGLAALGGICSFAPAAPTGSSASMGLAEAASLESVGAMEREVASHDQLLALAPETVVDQINYWKSLDHPLKVCFFRGGREIRSRIARAARGWELPGSAVRFDFGAGPNLRDCGTERSEIRIGFDYKGYSSKVGHESDLLPQSRQTMNFENWDVEAVADEKLNQVVLHEFGHALGLHHEHQNPWSVCESQFNWEVLRAVLGGPEFGWLPEKIEANMRMLHPDLVIASTFDDKSIMIYSFPPEFYHRGTESTCYHKENHKLSDIDRETILAIYPQSSRSLFAQRAKAYESLKNAVAMSPLSSSRKAGLLSDLNALTRELRANRH